MDPVEVMEDLINESQEDLKNLPTRSFIYLPVCEAKNLEESVLISYTSVGFQLRKEIHFNKDFSELVRT